jgi:hypothetical protein
MNLQQQDQFYQAMTRLKSNSRAASSKDDVRVTEIINGVITTRPARKVTNLESNATEEKEPIITLLGGQTSKAGSVPGINKLKAIHDFIKSNGRI